MEEPNRLNFKIENGMEEPNRLKESCRHPSAVNRKSFG